jgi:transposase
MSQRAAAKLLGVSYKTVQRDVGHSVPQSGTQSATGSAATKAARGRSLLSVRRSLRV